MDSQSTLADKTWPWPSELKCRVMALIRSRWKILPSRALGVCTEVLKFRVQLFVDDFVREACQYLQLHHCYIEHVGQHGRGDLGRLLQPWECMNGTNYYWIKTLSGDDGGSGGGGDSSSALLLTEVLRNVAYIVYFVRCLWELNMVVKTNELGHTAPWRSYHNQIIEPQWNLLDMSRLQYLVETEHYTEALDEVICAPECADLNRPDVFGNTVLHTLSEKYVKTVWLRTVSMQGKSSQEGTAIISGESISLCGRVLSTLFHLPEVDVNRPNLFGTSPAMILFRELPGGDYLCDFMRIIHSGDRELDYQLRALGGNTLIHWCFYGPPDHMLKAKLLVQHAAVRGIGTIHLLALQRNAREETALMLAAQCGLALDFIDLVRSEVIKAGGTPEFIEELVEEMLTCQDDRGWTYLDHAAWVGNLSITPTVFSKRQEFQFQLSTHVHAFGLDKMMSSSENSKALQAVRPAMRYFPFAIPCNSLIFGKALGNQGIFGITSEGFYRGRAVIIKEIQHRPFINDKPKLAMFEEVKNAEAIFVERGFGEPLTLAVAFKEDIDNGPFYIVMQKMPGVTLGEYLDWKTSSDAIRRNQFFRTRTNVALLLAIELAKMHDTRIVHGDLHAGNCLVVATGDPQSVEVSLIDFGNTMTDRQGRQDRKGGGLGIDALMSGVRSLPKMNSNCETQGQSTVSGSHKHAISRSSSVSNCRSYSTVLSYGSSSAYSKSEPAKIDQQGTWEARRLLVVDWYDSIVGQLFQNQQSGKVSVPKSVVKAKKLLRGGKKDCTSSIWTLHLGQVLES